MKKRLGLLSLILLMVGSLSAQDRVYETFAATRVINNHSIEMLPKRSLEFIVSHKFGDLAGSGGGYQTAFGLDNLADVRIAFEYGVSDDFDIGLGRCKGIGSRTQLLDGYAKYSFLHQQTMEMPVSMTFVSSMAFSYRTADSDPTAAASYPTFAHRFIFTNQLLVSRKFHDRFSMQIALGYNHRNYVLISDNNGVFFAGASGRIRFTKSIGLLFEYNHQLNRAESFGTTYNHLAFGIELLTGGHAFALTFANSRAMNENLFITGTTSDWNSGQFRFGFSINRRFKL